MSHTFFSRLSILVAFIAPAFGLDAHNAVKLSGTNAEDIIFMLSDHPKVALNNKTAVIVSDKEQLQYEFSDIDKIEFIDYELNSITGVYGDSTVLNWDNNSMEGHNLKPFSPVIITDLAGRIYSNVKTDASGSFYIDFIDLPTGVYMFAAPGYTFKFYKK